MRNTGQVVSQFTLPPNPPKAVLEADEVFRRLAGEYAEVQSQLAEANELKEHEVRQAHIAAANARIQNTAPPTKTADKVAQSWDENIRGLQTEALVIANALDTAGNALADAIQASKDEWVGTFIAKDREACKKLAKASEVVDEARRVIGTTRSAAEWLHGFSVSDVRKGEQTQFNGGGFVPGGRIIDLLKPQPVLRHYRNQVPIYERYDVEQLASVYEYEDGTPVEPEIVTELTSVQLIGRP
jgi:hypothetical protein